MKPSEILQALPQYANAAHEELLASPAWAMPCRLGETSCVMKFDTARPVDTLDVAILLEDERHTLSLADSPAFPELHAIWPSRAGIPAPVVLALVEKDCGAFLQMLENASRRQLKIEGLAKEGSSASGDDALRMQVWSGDAPLFRFALTSSPALAAEFGQLRFLDVSHQSVRETALQAETEIASFVIPAADVASLAQGDMLLLPEVGAVPPRLVVDGRFAVDSNGVSAFADDGRLRVVEAQPRTVSLGELFDAGALAESLASRPQPAPRTALKLMRGGSVLATGRFEPLADHPAMAIESKE